ncbi:MAG: proline--tRNA ligase, partial [Sphingopyxis sp.]
TQFPEKDAFIAEVGGTLATIQANLLNQARERMDANIRRDITDWDGIVDYFTNSPVPGWVEINWARPTGAALDAVVEKVKTLKLTMRNVPINAAPASGVCPLTGEAAVERILIGRSY